MNDKREMKAIVRKEWYRVFKDKKSYLVSLLTPFVFIVLFSFVMQKATAMGTDYTIRVYCENQAAAEKAEKVVKEYSCTELVTHSYEETDITENKVTIAVVIEDDTMHIIYDANLVSNTKAIYQAEMLADELSIQLTDTELFSEYQTSMVPILEKDISTAEEQMNHYFFVFFPFMYVLFIGMVNMFIMSLATDMISGERERGVFDAVLLSGVSESKLLFGKEIAIVSSAIPIYVTGFLSSMLGCIIYERSMRNYLLDIFLTAENIITLILFGISMAVLSGSIFLLISSCFNKVKQAKAYAGTGSLILSFLCLLNQFWKKERLEYIPIANVVSSMSDMLNGKLNFKAVLISSVSAILIAGILFVIAGVQIRRRKDD